jgi:hypothetical protein
MQAYRELGFALQAGGRRPEHGTRNAIWRTPSCYIELLAFEDEAPAHVRLSSGWPAHAALLQSGGGAGPFAVPVDDVAATVREPRARSIDVDGPHRNAFQRPDGSSAGWTAAALRKAPDWAPFFINYGLPEEEWIAASGEAVETPWSLHRLVIETPDPAGAAAWLAHVLGICPAELDAGTVGLPPARLRRELRAWIDQSDCGRCLDGSGRAQRGDRRSSLRAPRGRRR